MTQPSCQVRILTPESGRFERLRARLDQAEPGLLRASCRHWRVLPPPDARDGDVFLIDHQPAAGRDGLRLTRTLRADGGRQPVVLLLPPGTPPEAVALVEARLAMHYRAHLLGGTLTVRPGLDGAGTLVTCVFDPALDQDRSSGQPA